MSPGQNKTLQNTDTPFVMCILGKLLANSSVIQRRQR